MKPFFASILSGIFFTGSLFSQPMANSVRGFKPGIYFNAEELVRNNPTESPQDCSRAHCFQVFNDFGYSNLKVKTEQSSNYIYPAGTIFGFVDCYGRAYRYFEGKYFQILDLGSVNLFVSLKSQLVDSHFIPESAFFFSKTIDGELLPLERAEIIQAFKDFPEFAQLIETSFYPNVSLKQFNPASGIYELNQAYNNLTVLTAQR
jgi:hypothetical protein